MRIVLASSEAVPFSKTGGLADVAGALSKALSQAGHQVWLVTPYYPQLHAAGSAAVPVLHPTEQILAVSVGGRERIGRVLWAEVPGSDVTVLLVEQSDYFDRPGLYQDDGRDYKDNCERFVFFSRVVMEIARQLVIRPDVIHANDWQTGLVPALLKAEYRSVPGFERTGSVFTIHNMAFQGKFWHWDMLLTGLDWKYYNWQQMESFGHLNLLKTGIAFADQITTVSPTYAKEIQTPEFGCGLEGALASRRHQLSGILNGVDIDHWNPATDHLLPVQYSVDDWCAGKAACKAHLQQRLGLPQRSDVPLIGMISRMTNQKGLDLIADCAEEILTLELQMAFLGTGDERYERLLRSLAERYPSQVSATIGFDEPLAHLIEAGSDLYLMPSLYEPCGLNQMYSLIYGTVPIVRAVGGLADSVVNASPENLASGMANGFQFTSYNSRVLAEQVRRAVQTYHDQPIWKNLVENGMRRDFTWKRSAAEYEDVYRLAQSQHT